MIWLMRKTFAFLTADKRQTYCLYEAHCPDALRAAARRANLPTDVVVEVDRISVDSIRAASAS